MASVSPVIGQSSYSESIRVSALRRVRRNDTTDRLVFDRLTKLVSALLDVPVSLLLVADADQLLFASYAGPEDPWAEIEQFPIAQAYCQHALGARTTFAVEDARTDPSVCELAPMTDLGVVSYLGAPLLTSEGEPIGMLCAMDFAPRGWREADIRVVEDLAATAMAYIEARPNEPAATPQGGLNIAAVSRRTGVAADTLRKWERRYGILQPQRTAGGQRRYGGQDVARVEWLRDRLREGIRIGAASALLAPASGDTAETVEELREALVTAARLGEPSQLLGLVEQAFTLHSLVVAVDEIVAPALRGLGDAWESDSPTAKNGTVAAEHMLSEAVRAWLERMLSDRRGGVRGTAVLACGPGERHELGLLAVAVALQADGWLISYLGADLPTEAAISVARRIEADIVCLSVTLPESLARLAEELEAVPLERLLVVAGGPGVVGGGTNLPVRLVGPGLADIASQVRSLEP
ncbi:MAG: MerR family transcriptional regulator [Actinobacteria bacterium]|nr:MerR family transcriptional regulator [Actinomycetota bacterium]